VSACEEVVLMKVACNCARPGGALRLLAATLLLLAAPAAFAGLTVTLTDGNSDDVRMGAPYIGPQATVGGFVQWVVEVTSDQGEQQVALKDTLPDCMELLAYKDVSPDGTVNGTGVDPGAGMRREVQFHPPQRDALVSVDGNTILIQNIRVPDQGALRVTYWARVAGRSLVMPPARSFDTSTREGMLSDSAKRGEVSRTLAPRTIGTTFDGAPLGVATRDRSLAGYEETPRRAVRTRPIECSTCCNVVKVVDEEARLYLSDGPYDEVGFCAGTATGFEVLLPGATFPAFK
jgi:hypothetical protein